MWLIDCSEVKPTGHTDDPVCHEELISCWHLIMYFYLNGAPPLPLSFVPPNTHTHTPVPPPPPTPSNTHIRVTPVQLCMCSF